MRRLIIGRTVLQHSGIESRTLLEHKWPTLDETDCSIVGLQAAEKNAGHIVPLLVSRTPRTADEPSDVPATDQPEINFYDS